MALSIGDPATRLFDTSDLALKAEEEGRTDDAIELRQQCLALAQLS